jgi:hypothetical protein
LTNPDIPHPRLAIGESECVDEGEVLRRQVHPSWMDRGSPSSQAFKPTAKDDGQLSVRRESMSPEDAYRAHVESGLQSVGTWGVSVAEIRGTAGRAVDDSALPDVPEQHAYIDMRAFSPKQSERAAKALKRAALTRDCLYSPPE